MKKKSLSISIVIPVYNDEQSLLSCLNAINKLKVKPKEVIVVDNNSSDNSAAIAAGFSFVKIVQEPLQGVVHARSRGFNEASGDIIARIDADTIIYPDWLSHIKARFLRDENLSAISGPPEYYDFGLEKLANFIDRGLRRFLAHNMAEHLFLYGSNMAIRRSAWLSVKEQLCLQAGIHEDLDLAIHLQLIGLKIAYDDEMIAGASIRRMGSGFLNYVRYSLVGPRSYAVHGLSYQKYLYPVVVLCWLFYLPGHLIFLGYDQARGRLSLRTYLANRQREVRVDPTTNVA